MTKKCSLFLIVLSLIFPLVGLGDSHQSLPQATDKTALLKVIHLRDEAIRKRDSDVLDRILADEYMGVGSSSKGDLLSLVKNTKVVYQTVSSQGLAIKFYGDAATVTGIFRD